MIGKIKMEETKVTNEEKQKWDKLHQEIKTHCLPRCPRCQGTLQTINIHGHEQCVLCHSIVDDCCQGSQLK